MPKFLVEGTYTAEGFQGLVKEKASGRKAAVEEACQKLGGKLEAIYYCMGDKDVVLIVDMPDHVSVAALASAAAASGRVTTKTTMLLTVEEADRALATNVAYRAAGS